MMCKVQANMDPSKEKFSSPRRIGINDFDYLLPDHRIARFPLEQRDASKLLLYRGGKISHTSFRHVSEHLPPGALLIFNDTRVIHARLYFPLPNDSRLEILCLEPLTPVEYQQNFSATGAVRWKALVGGNRKWKTGVIEKEIHTEQGPVMLRATRIGRLADAFEVEFTWSDRRLAFGELLAAAGIIPLPPYLNRENVPADEERYQTVYARTEGSVAAPTAGLHFTDTVFADLDAVGIAREFVTLHVGAGTFRPVRSETIGEHHMHEESIYIRREVLQRLLFAHRENQPVIGVGTTSTRLLESLYWHGCRLLTGRHEPYLNVGQWEPYETSTQPPVTEALEAVLAQLDRQHSEVLQGFTQLIIAPGYSYRVIRGLITNFHQPRSTLLLLVAALVGDDWEQIYQYALSNDFRFLSYGDSSLLLP